MLVLSRREDQRILFPNLGITIEVLGIKGKNVRVGVDAPRDIRVIRGELAEDEPSIQNFTEAVDKIDQQLSRTVDAAYRHEVRNQLNTAGLAIHLAQRHLKNGSSTEAEKTLNRAMKSLRDLDKQLSVDQDVAADKTLTMKWKALLVEDDDNERELMAGILRMNGFEVDSVCDGVQAIEYLDRNASPDVVLMDMKLPRMSGPKTIAAIRSQSRHAGLKIYGVSGMELCETDIPLGSDGVTGWFCKPIDPNMLVSNLREQFEQEEVIGTDSVDGASLAG